MAREQIMTRMGAFCIAGLIFAIPVPALAAGNGDIDAGRKLAVEVCASCHGIGGGDLSSPEPSAPTFDTIAKTRGMGATALAVALRTPHATMPNLVLSDDELEDIIAYILSLKK
jgi:mono/diheme cytochrome c family protein